MGTVPSYSARINVAALQATRELAARHMRMLANKAIRASTTDFAWTTEAADLLVIVCLALLVHAARLQLMPATLRHARTEVI